MPAEGVRWYLMFPISYRDLELMLLDRGVEVDHSTISRWIQAYAAELEKRVRPHLRMSNGSWRVDETYVKIKGRWMYLYRAVDSRGQTIDFLLSAKRDAEAAKRFFRKALAQPHTVNPRTITVDKNAAYPKAITEMKKDGELWRRSRLRQVKYLNNIVEIVQSQMTKPDLLAGPARRHHVADLHLAIADDHSVDQEFDQGPPLLKCGLGQSVPHPAAEVLERAGEPGELLLPVRLRFELLRLLPQLPQAILNVTPPAPVFVQKHHPGEIGLGQPLELLSQARLSPS
jgi:IS6 family transposase